MLIKNISNFKTNSDMPTVIDAGSKITGDLEITTDVLVYGELRGSVKTENKVVVGKGGCIRGDVYAANLEVYGHIDGKVLIAEQTILHANSIVKGNIQTKFLSVQAGALIAGELFIDANDGLNLLNPITDLPDVEDPKMNKTNKPFEIAKPVLNSTALLPEREVLDCEIIAGESLTFSQSEPEKSDHTINQKQERDTFRIYLTEWKIRETKHVSIYSNLGEPIKISPSNQFN